MQIHWRFAKNAVANLGRGSASAVVALILPPILVRHMTPASYAVWVLVLQTAAYVSYLNFGLQTAVGRYVAFANEKKDVELRDSVFSTAFAGLCVAALLSLVCLAVAVLAAPAIFPSVPGPLIPQMRWALLLVGFSLAVELPASAWNGVFIGMERYELPAVTIGGARILSSLGVIVAALAGSSLPAMAAIITTANLLSYLAQYLALRSIAPDIHFRLPMVRRSTARELYGYCFGLTVMSFSMLLVTGFDLVLVGRFDFSAVIPYSVAASMIAFISGLLFAIINVILPHAATLHAKEKADEMGKLVISSTRISMLLLILTGVPILIYAGPILRLWIGSRYVAAGTPLLTVLIVANMIRLIGGPYSIVLIAAGQQKYIKIGPIMEGVSNFCISVVLGLLMGGIGVALGTFFGALVGASALLLYAMPRTKPSIGLSRRRFLLYGVLSPMLWTSPLIAVAAASLCGIAIYPSVFALAAVLSLLGAARFLYRRPHGDGQRDQIISPGYK
jgi:O-antigen/teichoic acid export membrane protein